MKRMSKQSHCLQLAVTTVFLGLSQGCGKEEMHVYSVPKETAQIVASPSRWSLPSGWTEQQAGGMRIGSFLVHGDGNQTADVSIIPLAGSAGTELDNVNRWRGQIGLQPVDADEYSNLKEAVKIEGKPASLVDLAGVDPNSNQPTRILGVITRMGDSDWFFKMIGPDELVAREKPAFVQFLDSFTFPGSSAPHAPFSDATLGRGPAQSPVQNASPGLPDWDIPSSWKPQPATSMLLGKFLVNDADLGNAEVTISAFPGDVGGLLANVNRWRSQLGLPGVTAENIASVTSVIDVGDQKATLVDMANSNPSGPAAAQRILVGVVPNGGKTWFFKILGSDRIVDRERPGFMKFLQSIRFPNDP
ncbi:MAG: hypothetical protein O2960_08880 [Verrucomicrobia bacterium]|nr:hypothetical protein [Verrucomicrobiota bacterium]